MRPMIRVIDVWKRYTQDGREEMSALRGATMEIAPGEIIALFGKSGCGKTTLLNLLAGLDHPTKGTIEVDGRDLRLLGEKGLTHLRRLRLGFVFQFFNLLPTLTAFENVFLSLELMGAPDGGRAVEALAEVGLAGKEGRYPYELSGGEQQRVAIARALITRPAIVLADEPTGNLDTKNSDAVLDMLLKSNSLLGQTTLMITHNPEAASIAGRILYMRDGEIVREEKGTRQYSA